MIYDDMANPMTLSYAVKSAAGRAISNLNLNSNLHIILLGGRGQNVQEFVV